MLNTHIGPAWSRGLDPSTPTFSGLLSESGYLLDYVGKWHVHEDVAPVEFGFDRYEMPKVHIETVPGSETFIDFPGGRQQVSAVFGRPMEEYHTNRFTSRGIEFVRERAAENRPFFLRIDTHAPHFANRVPEPHASLYDPASIPPWPNFEESFHNKPASHLRKHKEWHLEDKDWDWWSRVVAKYYGDVSLIDDCVGRVIDAIESAGIADNTIFMFSSDHGDSTGSHKHMEKAGTMYDEVFRVPLLIAGPGVKPGRTDEFVRLMDLMPTILELGGTEPPDGIDGLSLVPLISGSAPADWPRSVYCEHHGEVWGFHTQRSIRTHQWKYVYNPTDMDELYDLEHDPGELNNLVDDGGSAPMRDELKARLIGWNDATGDMFRWTWVRWNFPPPILPEPYASGRLAPKSVPK